MTELLPLILPTLVPAVSDAIRSIVRMFTGGQGAMPQTVDEAIRLEQAATERLKALAELDRPVGDISRWVADLRASFRYLAAAAILLNAFVSPLTGAGPEYVELSWQGAMTVWSFIFGDRMYNYIKRR